MKTALLILLLFPSFVFSQTPVDKLVRALDTLSTFHLDNWKTSPDLKGFRLSDDPTKAGFDDSKWDNLKLNASIYPDSCWLRKEITLPERILGQPVSGALRFLVSVDDYGYLWVNGESKGYFPWDGEFELTKDAKPGQKFVLAIMAVNTGGPLRLLRAEIESDAAKSIHNLVQDFSLSIKVGQKLLGFDTYQTNAHQKIDPGIDKSTLDREEKSRLDVLLQSVAPKIDVTALSRGELQKFTTSIESAKAELKPIGAFVKQFTLFFDANAHIDAAWLWRDKETIEVCKNTFTSVLNMMDARSDFTYTQSAAVYYDWMETLYPDLFKRIQQRVKDGRWEVVGGMWVEPDCNMPSGESWMRHLLYAQRYFRQKLGVDATIGYNPDSFGYNWNIPEFYAHAGIDAFVTQKIGWSERNVFPHRVFWWESPDGSRVLTYFPFDYVNTVDNPFRIVDQLRQFEANTGFRTMLVLFGVGDHGGGPTPEMLKRIDRLKNTEIFPNIELGTLDRYLHQLKQNDLSKLPVWKNELYLEYHQGCYTTQARTKEWNRKCEVLLGNTEKASALATLYGRPYNHGALEGAWRDVLFNQFHDILPGSGIRENYIDAEEKYRAVEEIGRFELNGSIKLLAQKVNTSTMNKGIPIIVFNPLGWQRSDVATLALQEGDMQNYAVFNSKGKEVASQMLQKDRYHREIMFIAHDVPSFGYAMYELRNEKSPDRLQGDLKVDAGRLENRNFTIVIDQNSGWIKSIVDKRTGKELLAGEGGKLQILEDKPKAWDAWNVGLTGVEYPTRLKKIEVVENGPIRATIRVSFDYLKPGVVKDEPTPTYPSSFFDQSISLYDDIDYIAFTTKSDWWEDKTMVKVAFPVTVQDTAATYEIPYGTIQRSTLWRDSWDSAKVEGSAQRWADLSAKDYGLSLLNRAKYGYDIKGNVMRLSLLRSPQWPDPTADRGKHSMDYALYPHKGEWKSGNTLRRGYEYNDPLTVFTTDSHKGALPLVHSFLQLTPENLVLTSIKEAEDAHAWIVQWYDGKGEESEAILTLPKTPQRVVLSNFLEQDLAPIEHQKNIVRVKTKKNGMQTVKIYF